MHISVKWALTGLFGLAAVASAAQGLISVRKISDMRQDISEIGSVRLPAVNVVNQINTAIRDHRVKLYRLVLSSNTADHRQHAARLRRHGEVG